MADWPISSHARVSAVGALTSGASNGTSLSAGGDVGVKGSWSELIAATAHEGTALQVTLISVSGVARVMVDIGIGGSGSEQVLIPDLHLSSKTRTGGSIVIPVTVPVGSRISARAASTANFGAVFVLAHVIGAGFPSPAPFTAVTAFGIGAGPSAVTVDPGGTSHTKGAWSEVTASTAAPIRGLFAAVGLGVNTAAALASWMIDVGVGASGSEQIIVPDQLAWAYQDTIAPGFWPVIPVDIPAGSRLAARAQCSITDATDRLFEIVLYGLR